MLRVKTGGITRLRRKRLLSLSKGFKSFSSKKFKSAHQQYLKSLTYSFVGRKLKKRYFRKIWIKKLNFFLKVFDFKYSLFMFSLKSQNISLNRKLLFEILA